jgi:hypothetical protein
MESFMLLPQLGCTYNVLSAAITNTKPPFLWSDQYLSMCVCRLYGIEVCFGFLVAADSGVAHRSGVAHCSGLDVARRPHCCDLHRLHCLSFDSGYHFQSSGAAPEVCLTDRICPPEKGMWERRLRRHCSESQPAASFNEQFEQFPYQSPRMAIKTVFAKCIMATG